MQHDPKAPQKDPQQARPRPWRVLLVSAGTLALSATLLLRARLIQLPSHFSEAVPSGLNEQLTGAGAKSAALSADAANSGAKPGANIEAAYGPNDDARLTQSLLMDSILSIIQNYYVDPTRVDNRALLDAVVAAMSTNPHIKTGVSPLGLWIDIDGVRADYPLQEKPRYEEVLAIFAAVATRLDQAHVTLVNGEQPEKNAPASVALLNALLSELDAHSALLSPDAYRELRQGTEGAFGGLGVLVGIRENQLTVIKPLPHSPAARAGIQKHDRILGIDGKQTYGYSLDDLVEYMRGEPGTEVKLSLLRFGAHAPAQMNLKREVIHVDSVTVDEIVKPDMKVLHLTVENFASRTSREVLGAIKKFKAKTKGVMNGLILDLRSNPGGLLDQAVQVADLFLKDGVIVTTRGRREEVERAGGSFNQDGFPVVVLIDGDSASASEIVAGALQDHQRALIIGQPSFGKGSVQTIFELPGERALKLTIARYYTPAGRSIQNVGIIPDVWLQPVAKRVANDNLFGPYRYKNERFLHNHLENAEATPAPTELALHQPTTKAYYLTDKVLGEGDDEATAASDAPGSGTEADREMELALKVIGKIRDTYGDKLPASADRASHWLGLAGPLVAQTVSKLDREASSWLKEKFNVDWSAAVKKHAAPNLTLSVNPANKAQVLTGDTLEIDWTISNHASNPESRVSVFLRSDTPGLETKEVLVGDVPAFGERTGKVKLPVPGHWEPGPLLLRVGAAVDAWPAGAAATADYHVQVVARPVAELSATAALVDEIGGHLPGVLESREQARIRLTVANKGKAFATDLSVKLINLSGDQVQIKDQALHIKGLAAGASQEVYVDVQGAKAIYTPELAFGLYVEGQDLRVPLRQRITIKGQLSPETASNAVTNMTH